MTLSRGVTTNADWYSCVYPFATEAERLQLTKRWKRKFQISVGRAVSKMARISTHKLLVFNLFWRSTLDTIQQRFATIEIERQASGNNIPVSLSSEFP